jgi:high-affinity iron transporter
MRLAPASALLLVTGWAHAEPASESDARLLVGVLDYVAADYGGAVKGGKVVSEAEYREQVAFVEEALALGGRVVGLPESTTPRLRELARLVGDRGPTEDVASRCRAIRDAIVGKLRLIVAPPVPPDAARGAALFAQHCVACHGSDGRARTERAAELKPPPRNFHDRDVLSGLSPYRAYGAVTFGVSGTAMAAFPTLSDDDRWSLAFHVFSFLHGPRARRGRDAFARAGVAVPLGEITLRSDGELEARLRGAGLPPGEAADAVSYLRVEGYRRSADPLASARGRVLEAERAHAAGRSDRALALLLDAYLAYEAVEGQIGAREADLVRETEAAFMDLRAAFRGESSASEAGARARRVDRLLGEAQAVLTQAAPRGALAFWASLVIFAREAVEAALLVGLLLGMVARSGRSDLRRFVHAGWSAALLAGLVTFAVASRVLSGQVWNQEVLEGVVSLLAAGVLFYVSYWTLSQAQSQRWLAYLRERMERGGGRATVLFGLAFLAVYREAFETVLFYQALLLERDADRAALLGGAGAGAALALAVVWLLRRIGARLPMAAFFSASGALLCLLAVVFAGAGLHDLRKGGWIDPRPIALPALELLGLYPDAVGLTVQGAMVLLIAAGLAAMARGRGAR